LPQPIGCLGGGTLGAHAGPANQPSPGSVLHPHHATALIATKKKGNISDDAPLRTFHFNPLSYVLFTE
jgi:hypothetical protein